jgi:hypothetical protein
LITANVAKNRMVRRSSWGVAGAVVALAAFVAPIGLACAKSDSLFKIYWEEGYFWQGNRTETFWCMECASSECAEGDGIEVQECEEDNLAQRWQHLQVAGGGSQIKTTGRNLCLTTPGNKYLNLTRCDENDKDQLFEGIKENGERFEWGSYGEKLQVKRCITPHHHPRKGELIFKENCEKARITKSSFWMKYKPSSVLSLREYGSNDCFAGNPCGECSGDCDDDSSCDGDLKCFQRDNFERVPGCAGNGQDGWDYCVSRQETDGGGRGHKQYDDEDEVYDTGGPSNTVYDEDGGNSRPDLASAGSDGCVRNWVLRKLGLCSASRSNLRRNGGY